MHTLRRFFQNIFGAAFKPQTYGKHLKEKTSTGLGYLYWLLVCISTVTAIILAGLYIPARIGIRTFISGVEPQLQALYPNELVLTLQSGSLSTNMEEPYVIDPAFFTAIRNAETTDTTTQPTHLVTIDTNASIEDFATYDTVMLVTRTHIVGMNDRQIRAYALSELQTNIVVNREKYDQLLSVITPFIHKIPTYIDIIVIVALLLVPFAGAGLSWAWHLFTLLIWSLLFWAISGIMGRKLRYGQIYRLGMYGLTLPLILSTILTFIPGIGLLPNIIFIVFMIIVLNNIPRPTMPARTMSKKAPAPIKKSVKKKAKTSKE